MRAWIVLLCACSGGVAVIGGDTDASTTPPPNTTQPNPQPTNPTVPPGRDRYDVNDVCELWNSRTSDMSEPPWQGDIDKCTSKDLDADVADRALRLTNMYRWLAHLEDADADSSLAADAQQCAMLMQANSALSHDPPSDWLCWSKGGAAAAAASNIAPVGAMQSVGLYMVDPDNEDTLAHRRWLLSQVLGPIAFGAASNYSCMWVVGSEPFPSTGEDWVAWPPPGPVPVEALVDSWTEVDETGWSIQSDTIDFAGANVTVKSGDTDLAVTVQLLDQNYGSVYGLRIVPQGWATGIGNRYQVDVSGLSTPISYEFNIVACN